MAPDRFSGRTYVSAQLSTTDPGHAIIVLEGRTWIATIPVPEWAWSMAFSPDPARAYVVLHTAGAVVVIDTVSLTVIETIPVGNRPFEVVLGRVPAASTPTPTATSAVATATPAQSRRSDDGCAITPRASSVGARACLLPLVLPFLRRRHRVARLAADQRDGTRGLRWSHAHWVMTRVRFVVLCIVAPLTVLTGRLEASDGALVILRGAGEPGDSLPVQLDLVGLTALRELSNARVDDIPLPTGETVSLRLERFSPVAADATVQIDYEGPRPFQVPAETRHFWGEVPGSPDSVAYLVVGEKALEGFVRLDGRILDFRASEEGGNIGSLGGQTFAGDGPPPPDSSDLFFCALQEEIDFLTELAAAVPGLSFAGLLDRRTV
jgi:YVTN family beta-propeller protein